MKTAALLLVAILAGCGGGDPAPEHFLLFMETRTHTSEFIFVYDTASDCTGAGSYRLLIAPDKYIGYSCKTV